MRRQLAFASVGLAAVVALTGCQSDSPSTGSAVPSASAAASEPAAVVPDKEAPAASVSGAGGTWEYDSADRGFSDAVAALTARAEKRALDYADGGVPTARETAAAFGDTDGVQWLGETTETPAEGVWRFDARVDGVNVEVHTYRGQIVVSRLLDTLQARQVQDAADNLAAALHRYAEDLSVDKLTDEQAVSVISAWNADVKDSGLSGALVRETAEGFDVRVDLSHYAIAHGSDTAKPASGF